MREIALGIEFRQFFHRNIVGFGSAFRPLSFPNFAAYYYTIGVYGIDPDLSPTGL